jgi:HNH endonuclease/AP2 domain
MLTQEQAKELFSYNPEEGILRWRKWAGGCCRKDLIAGYRKQTKGKPTYWVVMLKNKNHKVHQIIWVYMTGKWPDKFIDHEDLDGTNNKWSNLRLASNGQNMMNGSLRSDNTTGVKGISWDQRRGNFRARLVVDGIEKYLGSFDDVEEAAKVRAEAAKKYHGEFARI